MNGRGGPGGPGGPGNFVRPDGMGGPGDKGYPDGNPPNENGTNQMEYNGSRSRNGYGLGGRDGYGAPNGAGIQGNFGDGNGGPGGFGGNGSNLQGQFGGEISASFARLFTKNILSDQIVWFIILALLGFIATAIQEKLKITLNTSKKQNLMMWFMWFLPVFLYFSFNTGTFHSYYLTMLAPPTAALAGIGIITMWEMYQQGGWKSWFLPASLIVNGVVQLLMQSYFISLSNIVVVLMIMLVIFCFGASTVLIIFNIIKKKPAEEGLVSNNNHKLQKILVSLAVTGLMITPLAGSSAAMFYQINGSFPAAGLELLSSNRGMDLPSMSGTEATQAAQSYKDSAMVQYLKKNKTPNQKYLLVVSNSNSGSDIIINSNESVMSLGGFLGNNSPLTLDEFKALVKKGEIRYVMSGGQRGGGGESSNSEILSWVQQTGTLVPNSEYSNTTTQQAGNNANMQAGFGGDRGGGSLYDLKAYTDSTSVN